MMTTPTQSDRFEDAARALECDDDPERFPGARREADEA